MVLFFTHQVAEFHASSNGDDDVPTEEPPAANINGNDTINGEDEDDDAMEFVTLIDGITLLDPFLNLLRTIHTLVSLSMMISYCALKVRGMRQIRFQLVTYYSHTCVFVYDDILLCPEGKGNETN